MENILGAKRGAATIFGVLMDTDNLVHVVFDEDVLLEEWYGCSDLSMQTVAISGYLEPLSALLFSAVLLGENLNLVQTIGAVLILGGAALGELFRQKWITRTS